MKLRLIPVIVQVPDPDAARELDEALDTLADALAEQLMARARAEALGKGQLKDAPPAPRQRRATASAVR